MSGTQQNALVNDGRPFTDTEYKKIIQFMKDGDSIKVVAEKLRRTQFNIRYYIANNSTLRALLKREAAMTDDVSDHSPAPCSEAEDNRILDYWAQGLREEKIGYMMLRTAGSIRAHVYVTLGEELKQRGLVRARAPRTAHWTTAEDNILLDGINPRREGGALGWDDISRQIPRDPPLTKKQLTNHAYKLQHRKQPASLSTGPGTGSTQPNQPGQQSNTAPPRQPAFAPASGPSPGLGYGQGYAQLPPPARSQQEVRSRMAIPMLTTDPDDIYNTTPPQPQPRQLPPRQQDAYGQRQSDRRSDSPASGTSDQRRRKRTPPEGLQRREQTSSFDDYPMQSPYGPPGQRTSNPQTQGLGSGYGGYDGTLPPPNVSQADREQREQERERQRRGAREYEERWRGGEDEGRRRHGRK